ncbi:hypothetical protein ACLOJK_025659 [Asimina triloba]
MSAIVVSTPGMSALVPVPSAVVISMLGTSAVVVVFVLRGEFSRHDLQPTRRMEK